MGVQFIVFPIAGALTYVTSKPEEKEDYTLPQTIFGAMNIPIIAGIDFINNALCENKVLKKEPDDLPTIDLE